MDITKISNLLDLVIESYLDKGEPIGSKFLYSLDETQYAPSTLRKYLNVLEKEGFLYQPYNSAGRIPTIKGISKYIDLIMQDQGIELQDELTFDIKYTRNGLRFYIEALGNYIDGTVVGFIKDDEYYFLGINKLFKDSNSEDYLNIKSIIKFIEEKKIIYFLNKKLIKRQQIYYTFINSEETDISCIYLKIDVNGFDCIIAILGPIRVDYKRNLLILRKFIETCIN